MINYISVTKVYYENNHVGFDIVKPDGETTSVPLDINNTDYQNILEWIENGGTVIDNGGE